MRRFFFTFLFTAAVTAAAAAEAPVKPTPGLPDTGLTVNECLTILSGLNALDGRQVVVSAGKPDEKVINLSYDFGNAKLRMDIAHDMAVLGAIQRDSQTAQQGIFLEVGKGADIKPGTPEYANYDKQLKDLVDRPCHAALARIKAADLKLDRNDIPGSVLAAIDKILDK